jgi:hypothetical protein
VEAPCAAQDVAAQGIATPSATMPGVAAQGASTVQPALQQ